MYYGLIENEKVVFLSTIPMGVANEVKLTEAEARDMFGNVPLLDEPKEIKTIIEQIKDKINDV